MKTLMAALGLGFAGLVFLWWAGVVCLSLYGVYVVFSASVIMGIICLFVGQPLFPISGALLIFAHTNLPLKILEFIAK